MPDRILKSMLEIVEGAGAALLVAILFVLMFAQSAALDLLPKLSKTWKGKRTSPEERNTGKDRWVV